MVFKDLQWIGKWKKFTFFEMQLVDFQNSAWIQGFVWLKSVIENLERNRLRNENEYNYEEEILKVKILDTYTNLKD